MLTNSCNKKIYMIIRLYFTSILLCRNLTQKFGELLVEGGSMSASPLVIFIDGLDMMEKSHQPCNLEWLPREIPKVSFCPVFTSYFIDRFV